MSLLFYKDAELTRPVTAGSPVWIFSPNKGATRSFSLWLADTYSTSVSQDAAAGATSLHVTDASGFPETGHAIVNGLDLAYTISGLVLTVAPLALSIPAGSKVYPKLTYTGETALTIASSGSSKVRLKRPDQSSYGIPNVPLLYAFSSAVSTDLSGPRAIARVDLQVQVAAGEDADLSDLRLTTNSLSAEAAASLSQVAVAWFTILRMNQGLSQRFRLFPANRALTPEALGFTWGDYRWREQDEVNAHSLIATVWDLDVDKIGREKFIAGIGDGDDLLPVSLEKTAHSIHARVQPGTYFTGPNRYYLPSDDRAVLVSNSLTIRLGDSRPRTQKPLFVGAFKMDREGYYDDFVRYEYAFDGFTEDGPEYQFTRDCSTNTIYLNKRFELTRMFLGVAPQADLVTFDLPVHPVSSVSQVRLGAFGTSPEESVFSYAVDYTAGTITIAFSSPEDACGRDLYVYCQPAVMVVFETKPAVPQNSVLLPVDLNPAFAGISNGYLYLEHRKRRPALLELSCDKPRILTPQGYEMVSGLISFGPVFYENDFALLQAKAFGSHAGEVIPGARLRVIPDASFRGALNYQDLSAGPVFVTTGADGIASMIYTPPDAFGQYLALSSISGTDVTLPAPLPLQRLWNVDEGWLVRLYQVYNNDGFFGKVGANPSYGEIVWHVSGTPGEVSYRTNGRRALISASNRAVLPLLALDAAGRDHTDPSFDGNAVKLRYEDAVPEGFGVGSYFLTYIGRLTLQVQSVDSGLVSNVILLDLQTPPEVVDESGVSGYLRPNAGGRLNINRLGGSPVLPINVNNSRY